MRRCCCLIALVVSLAVQEAVRPAPGVPGDAQGRIALDAGLMVFSAMRDGAWHVLARPAVGEPHDTILMRAPTGTIALTSGFAPGGRRLYFESNVRIPAVQGREDSDVWLVDRTAGDWERPRPLGPPFDTIYNEHAPSADARGTLCFNSARPGGIGGNDLYCGRIDRPDPPQLVREISSPAQDAFGWLTADGSSLWFASNRAGGAGGWDLYYSTGTAAGWSAPRNPGAPINSAQDETAPWIADGRLYFRRAGSGTSAILVARIDDFTFK